MRDRSSSAPPRPRYQASVTLDVAKNDKLRASHGTTRTVTATNVRGFTQGDDQQRPTVYLQDGGVPSGRATQEHAISANVGAHYQHGREAYFGNVSSQHLRQATHRSGTKRAVAALNRERQDPAGPNAPKQLVEVFSDSRGRVTGSHTSRSAFLNTTGPGKAQSREHLINSLKQGPLNVNSLAKQTSGARDDWHVGQNSRHQTPK